MKFPFGKSALRKAIEKGIEKGDLEKELDEVGDIVLKTKGDAEAVCWGLEQLRALSPEQLEKQTNTLARLFQEVEPDGDAIPVLGERGILELLRLYDCIRSNPETEKSDTLFFLLKIFAMYGTTEGALKVIDAARQPLRPETYMWSVIFEPFRKDHPQNELLFRELADPLPTEFMAVALLDAANRLLIEGETIVHPFDSKEGKERLEAWLRNPTSEDTDSYAESATAALPFISNPDKEPLLKLAMEHANTDVRIQAAWAAAKMGDEEGFRHLAGHCLDFNTAEKAKHYLTELGRENLIPAKAREPDFCALAEFSRWCAHPNELGKAPDELSILDHRELSWPPEHERKPCWLIKYRQHDTTGLSEDDVGVGMVGSVTFCFFSREMTERPPEDGYAIHCYWEMEHKHLIEETDVREEQSEYASLLAQWNGSPLEDPRMLFVAEISPDLRYPRRLVGLATALQGGHEGWAVLDAGWSQWYPKVEMPANNSDRTILAIHVGSRLLGFDIKLDRKRYLAGTPLPKPASQVIAAYEKLLKKAPEAAGKKRSDRYEIFRPLDKHLERYLTALTETGRVVDVRKTLEILMPLSDRLSNFGVAAWKAGELEIAEKEFLHYRNTINDYQRGDEMGYLAEIWFAKGKRDEAMDLLLDCLKRLLEESKTATDSDIDLFERWFQERKATLTKLFPNASAILARAGVPETTISKSV